MQEYNVEFTTTITIEANSEDEAVELATKMVEEEMETEGASQFYVYVNGRGGY